MEGTDSRESISEIELDLMREREEWKVDGLESSLDETEESLSCLNRNTWGVSRRVGRNQSSGTVARRLCYVRPQ